jgi:23S rRNA (guanosine2251-2'-O)-methyltransferase
MKNRKPRSYSKNKASGPRDRQAKGRGFASPSYRAPERTPDQRRDESAPGKPFRTRDRFAKDQKERPASPERHGRAFDNRREEPNPRRPFFFKAKDKAPDSLKEQTYKARPAKPAFAPSRRPKPAPPEHKGIMMWGVHAVREAWLNPKRICYNLWLTEAGMKSMAGALSAAVLEGLNRPSPTVVERHELDRLLPPSSVHQGVAIACEPLPDAPLHAALKSQQQADLLIVLDRVTDPHNVGAILRSAAAFGAVAVIMTERNAPSSTGVLAKTASGALEHVPLIHVTNLSRALVELQEAGFWCVGLTEDAEIDLGEIDLSGKTALVLGAEGEGLRRLTREGCDELARLPTGGAIGSLNVSNAAAVALYEARKQLKKKP